MMLEKYKEQEKQIIKRLPWHEAGHCVAAILLGRRFDYVTINPNGKYSGHVCNVQGPQDMDDALISTAGLYAEKIKFNSYSVRQTCSDDFEHADKIIISMCGRDALTMVHREIMEKANAMLMNNWGMVEAIATGLQEMKTLTYKQVADLIQ